MYEPVELDMYTDVLKIKKLIHHIKKIPLPFPMTTLGLITGFALEWAAFYIQGVDPITKHVFIPLTAAGFITYHEPDGINLFQVIYAYSRQYFRKKRRVVNRAVMVPKNHPEPRYIGGLTRIELQKGEGS